MAVLEKGPGFLTKHFCGPMQVVYNLCREWEKTKEVELIVLENTLISLLRSRYEHHFPPIRDYLLMRRAHRCQFDILNIHGVSRIGVEITKLCKKRRIPTVYTAHGPAYKHRELGYPYSKEFIHQEELLVRLSDKIVAVSPTLKNLLIDEYGLPDEKVDVVYNGVDPNLGRRKYPEINIRKKYSIPNNRKILLNVGGTIATKDVPFLIKALKLLKRNDWHLIIVGPRGGEHRDVIRECNSKLGNHYTFTGLIGFDEVLSFYHQANLYIATSKDESYGLTPLEAMSCGTDAVVRSTMAAAKEYFCNIPTLVDRNIFDTPQELADIITNYLSGHQKIEKELLQKILQYHSWENRAKEYLQIFRQLRNMCQLEVRTVHGSC